MPKVSVVIPTRNRCDHLKRAVASVLDQTCRDLEIIIVNDGSNDGTAAYLNSLDDSRITSLNSEKNLGGSFARNQGIARSKGAYISFLDDDDAWEPSKLEEQLLAMERSNADLCHTGINCFAASGRFIKYVFMRPRYVDNYKSMMNDNYFGGTSSITVKKSALEAAGLFDESLPALQDWDLYIRLLRNGCTVYGINEPLVNYYIMDESKNISSSFTRYHDAAKYVKEKYRTAPHFSLLKRRLLIIGIKRCIKSRHHFFDALRYYVLPKRPSPPSPIA